MKLVEYYRFGSSEVLEINEVPVPVPDKDELLIEVMATTVNSGDVHLRSGKPMIARLFAGPIIPRNKGLGSTASGRVVAVGDNVTDFTVGDEVFASKGITLGTHGEYILFNKADAIALKPKTLSYNEAAALVFGSLTAKYFLDQVDLSSGTKVLIIGGAGGVGAYSIQLSKYYGAEVTAVCNRDDEAFVKALGADRVMDYSKNDIYQTGHQYDVIFDMVGQIPLHTIKKLIGQKGVYMTTKARLSILVQGLLNKKQFVFDVTKSTGDDLKFIGQLAGSTAYRPLVGSTYSLEDVVKAHDQVKSKGKRGAVVLEIKKATD